MTNIIANIQNKGHIMRIKAMPFQSFRKFFKFFFHLFNKFVKQQNTGRMYSLGEVNFIKGMLNFGKPKNSVGLKPITILT